MTDTAPQTEGVEATFRHVDDIEWTPVQAQRNADGSTSVIRERWPIMRPDFLSAYVHYEPGMVVRRHGHRSNHVVIVLDGGGWIGGEWSTAGTHVHVPLGALFGPIVAGPDGVTCWELSFGDFGGWSDETASYDREIAARGVTPLPDPPLVMPDWWVDPRGDTGAVRATPKVEGLREVVTRLDDLPATEVRVPSDAGVAVAGVRRRRAIAAPDLTSARTELDPGATLPRHGRSATHLVLVIDGGAWFGDHWCPAGTHIELPAGAAFGPIVAGDDGAIFLELTDGDDRSWTDPAS
jgi:quercetin dioxygenase-like cupin family protein